MNCLDTAGKPHAPELRAWLRHRMSQPQEVDDLLQDLYLKAWGQGARFCDVANARAWLFEVARNALADRLRMKREWGELRNDLASEDLDQDAVDQLSM